MYRVGLLPATVTAVTPARSSGAGRCRSRTRFRLSSLVSSLGAVLLLPWPSPAPAQGSPRATGNVVLVMLDGVRWQEVFSGADSSLISRDAGGVSDTASLRKEFWRPDPAARRRLLMPFVWDSVGERGQLFGNGPRGSIAETVNTYWFSYPGYSEALTAVFDSTINSNSHPPNRNVTVFEWLNGLPEFNGNVAAFAAWDAFDRIFNEARADFPVYSGWQSPWPSSDRNAAHAAISSLYSSMIRYWDVEVWDGLMHQALLHYVREEQPRVLFVGYGEPDEWSHARRYDLALQSLHNADKYISELWTLLQSLPQYQGRTTLIVTTDHGRGGDRDSWTDHGADVAGAGRVWLGVLGPDTAPLGERMNVPTIHQAQVAATVAALLGRDFQAFRPKAHPPIRDVLPH